MDRFAEKSAENLLQAIAKSKQNPLPRLIFGLGIRNIGLQAAKLLCDAFPSMDAIMQATAEQISEIEGFGMVMAESVVAAFREPHMQHLIAELKRTAFRCSIPKRCRLTSGLQIRPLS